MGVPSFWRARVANGMRRIRSVCVFLAAVGLGLAEQGGWAMEVLLIVCLCGREGGVVWIGMGVRVADAIHSWPSSSTTKETIRPRTAPPPSAPAGTAPAGWASYYSHYLSPMAEWRVERAIFCLFHISHSS